MKKLLFILTFFIFISEALAQNVEITVSSRIKVNNSNYNGAIELKAAIIDDLNNTLWSNDGTSVAASQPTTFVPITVTESVFNVTLGDTSMSSLPESVFYGTQKLFVVLWVNAGFGFEQFDNLPISRSPRAVDALSLAGIPASNFLTTSSVVPVGNTNLTEAISSSNIAAFSNSQNDFTLGDGADASSKSIFANTSNVNDPALRYNTSTSKWEFTNDGTTFSEIGAGTANSFEGSGSVTTAVDLNTAEVSGVLAVANGGTAAASASAARSNLGLEIGVDVLAFQKNNYSAVVAPSATDDSNSDYSVGSIWVDTALQDSYIAVDVTPGAAIWKNETSVDTASIANGAITNAKLAANSVTSSNITNNEIVNNDINSSAGINLSKLESVASGNIVLGNASNIATSTAVSGDATISNTGALSLSNGSVTGAKIGISGQVQGDLLYYDSSTWNRLAIGTSGNVLKSNGTTPVWGTVTGAPHVVLDRRYGYSMPLTTAITTFTSVGITAPTVTGTATAQPALPSTNRMYIRYATAAAANSIGGITGPLTETRPNFRPRYTTTIRTDATITNRRIWVALTTAALALVPTDTTTTPVTAQTFVGIAYDTAGVGNLTDWLCCSGDGANYGCATTGVAVTTSTEYTMELDWSTLGSLICKVNGTSVTRTTTLGTAVVNMGPNNTLTTITASSALHYISKQSLEQN